MTSAQEFRDSGKCPWSSCACKRAPLCVLSATEACAHIVNRGNTCSQCRKDSKGTCADMFLCFKDVRDAQRGKLAFNRRRR